MAPDFQDIPQCTEYIKLNTFETMSRPASASSAKQHSAKEDFSKEHSSTESSTKEQPVDKKAEDVDVEDNAVERISTADEYADAEKNYKPKTLKFWLILGSVYLCIFLVALVETPGTKSAHICIPDSRTGSHNHRNRYSTHH